MLEKFWILDLSRTSSLLQSVYSDSKKGTAPHDPANLLRSYLLALQTGYVSITKWVEALRHTPLFRIISGFSSDNIPGVGTFYDFFERLWAFDT